MDENEWKAKLKKENICLVDDVKSLERVEKIYYFVIQALMKKLKSEIELSNVEYLFIYDRDKSSNITQSVAMSAYTKETPQHSAIGISTIALNYSDEEIISLMLHELVHVVYNKEIKTYNPELQHNELFEALTKELFNEYNVQTDSNIKNHHNGYGLI